MTFRVKGNDTAIDPNDSISDLSAVIFSPISTREKVQLEIMVVF